MATRSSLSPFVEQRRENSRVNASVYINYEDYPKWASVNNYLITGSRGTGKSSILASFDYRLRWLNSNAITYSDEYLDLLTTNVKETDIIGIVLKADRIEAQMWDFWYNNGSINGSLLFSSYISFYFASKILVSIKDIINAFYPDYSTFLFKTSLISRLYRLCDASWNRKYALLYDFSIEGLISFLSERSIQIRQTIYTGGAISDFSDTCLHSASSGFISDFCSIICEEIDVLKEKKIFLMIDDVDRFKTWQIRCINSFLKVTSYPCSWKLSSSLPYQTLATEDGARISGTDLKISNLNDESVVGKGQNKERIDELYDAIFKSRLKESGIPFSRFGNIQALFGKMDLEKALKDVVDQSLNQSLKEEYSDFLGSDKKYFTDYWLIKKRILNQSDSRKRFDKYRVNATFAIIKSYNLEDTFRYCSYEIIRAICAGSPRHFLRICDSMWPAIAERLNTAIKGVSPINKDDQNRAIRKASNDMLEVIDKDRFNQMIQPSCKDMCNRLGNLFVLLTNNENSLRRSQECMSVSFDLSEINDMEIREDFLKIMDKLTMMEVIKIRTDIDNPLSYQLGLNPMLSPCFCISFRNPFLNSVKVDARMLYSFLTKEEEIDPRTLAPDRFVFVGPSLFDAITDE